VPVVHVRIARDDLRLERGDAPGERGADVAEPDDAHGLAMQRARAARHAARPDARSHLTVECQDLAIPRQQQRERVVGDLADPDVRDVDDDDAKLGGRTHVDDVVADAGAHDDLEALERAEHRARYRRKRDDERVRVAGARDQRIRITDEGQRDDARRS
jgi:hypothetical protein